MKSKKQSTLKILDYLERSMPFEDEEPVKPRLPPALAESDINISDVDKKLAQGTTRRPRQESLPPPRPDDDSSGGGIDPIVIPADMGFKKKKLIDRLMS